MLPSKIIIELMNFYVPYSPRPLRLVLYFWMNEWMNLQITEFFLLFHFNSFSYVFLCATRRNGQSRAVLSGNRFIHRKNRERGCPRPPVGILGHLVGRVCLQDTRVHKIEAWAFSTVVTRLAIAASEEARTMANFIFSPRKPSNLITKNSFFFIFTGICNINNEFEK